LSKFSGRQNHRERLVPGHRVHQSESLDTYATGKRHLRDREAIDVARDIIEALIAIHPDSARLLELDAKNKSGELCLSELLPGVVDICSPSTDRPKPFVCRVFALSMDIKTVIEPTRTGRALRAAPELLKTGP
jgi:hypothetical protein